MYGISVQYGTHSAFVRSEEITKRICTLTELLYREEAIRHLCAIEHLEARGITYCNEDFDVLSAAHRFANALEAECLTLEYSRQGGAV